MTPDLFHVQLPSLQNLAAVSLFNVITGSTHAEPITKAKSTQSHCEVLFWLYSTDVKHRLISHRKNCMWNKPALKDCNDQSSESPFLLLWNEGHHRLRAEWHQFYSVNFVLSCPVTWLCKHMNLCHLCHKSQMNPNIACSASCFVSQSILTQHVYAS